MSAAASCSSSLSCRGVNYTATKTRARERKQGRECTKQSNTKVRCWRGAHSANFWGPADGSDYSAAVQIMMAAADDDDALSQVNERERKHDSDEQEEKEDEEDDDDEEEAKRRPTYAPCPRAAAAASDALSFSCGNAVARASSCAAAAATVAH